MRHPPPVARGPPPPLRRPQPPAPQRKQSVAAKQSKQTEQQVAGDEAAFPLLDLPEEAFAAVAEHLSMQDRVNLGLLVLPRGSAAAAAVLGAVQEEVSDPEGALQEEEDLQLEEQHYGEGLVGGEGLADGDDIAGSQGSAQGSDGGDGVVAVDDGGVYDQQAVDGHDEAAGGGVLNVVDEEAAAVGKGAVDVGFVDVNLEECQEEDGAQAVDGAAGAASQGLFTWVQDDHDTQGVQSEGTASGEGLAEAVGSGQGSADGQGLAVGEGTAGAEGSADGGANDGEGLVQGGDSQGEFDEGAQAGQVPDGDSDYEQLQDDDGVES